MQIEMFPDARKARDKALKQVRDNAGEDWWSQCMTVFRTIRHYHSGELMIAEEIRLLLEPRLPPPHHHNIWGAVIANLAKAHLIEDSGLMGRMKTIKSHARKTTLWRIT